MKQFHQLIALGTLIGATTACRTPPGNTNTELAVPVSVSDIKPRYIEKVINATGMLNATKKTVLNTEMTGKFKLMINSRTHRQFALGDMFENGQVVVQLEDAEYVNAIGFESCSRCSFYKMRSYLSVLFLGSTIIS